MKPSPLLYYKVRLGTSFQKLKILTTLFLPPHTVCAGLFLVWTWRLHEVGQQMETARSYYNQPNYYRPKDVT